MPLRDTSAGVENAVDAISTFAKCDCAICGENATEMRRSSPGARSNGIDEDEVAMEKPPRSSTRPREMPRRGWRGPKGKPIGS